MLYSQLREAGRRVNTSQFLAIEVCVLVLMILWTEVVWMLARGREFGLPRVNLYLAVAVSALHILGTVHWFGVTKAALASDSCTQATDDSSDLPIICSALGPILALVNCVVIGFTAVLFAHLYEQRATNIMQIQPSNELKDLQPCRADESIQTRI